MPMYKMYIALSSDSGQPDNITFYDPWRGEIQTCVYIIRITYIGILDTKCCILYNIHN